MLDAYDASHGAGGAGGAQRITNVANGVISNVSPDAINGSQLHATITNLVDILGTGVVNPDGTITDISFAAGYTTINDALTNIYNAIYYGPVHSDALLWNGSLNAFDASYYGGAQKITNVANGVISNVSPDAINGSQLHATATSIVNMLGTGTVSPDGAITGGIFITGGTTINQALENIYYASTGLTPDALLWDGTLSAFDASHGTGNAQRITNIASGLVAPGSLDAINGSQLYNTAAGIINILGTGTVNPDGTITGGTSVSQSITTINQAVNNRLV